jgi:nicotinate-nucleotide pyrophosphorylase (carboxylating)
MEILPHTLELMRTGLEEDSWQWDWTTLGTVGDRGSRPLRARVIAKSSGVWAASALIPALNSLARELGARGDIARSRFKDGQRIKPGDVVCEWSGPARLVLALERPFLNLASYVSGIATTTASLVSEVKRACPKRPPRVTPTRKTLPAYRDLAVMGVIAGGGFSHRVSLSGGVLIKENHIAAAGSIAKAVSGARAIAPHGLKIEIEVRSLKELGQALKADADGVLLDNFTPAQVREALSITNLHRRPVVIEVSGGITESNIAKYAIEGVDLISSGSLTLSVKIVDLSMIAQGVSKL